MNSRQPIAVIEYQAIDDLIPYARNSRTHSHEQIRQIAASIREFGFTNPVLIDDAGGIIAGHGRVMGAREVGLQAVPCIRLGYLTEAQRRAYVIADNKLALNAGWDEELLAAELADLQDDGFDLDLTGFSEDELDRLLADTEEDGRIGETDADDVPDARPEPISRPGDVWIIGRHRVMCGDSTSIEAVETLMDGKHADLLLTDPPYNVAYDGGIKEKLTIKNDSMGDEQFRQFLRDAYTAADTVMKPGAVFYIWHADTEGYNFCGAAKDAGWKVRQCLIWKKSSLVLGRQDYQSQHEPCLYGWKDGAAHYWGSDRKQTTILEFDKPSRNGEHPTMKPVDLFEYQIVNISKKGDVVLDLFGGSRTTAIACEKSARSARIMELDPKYVDVIVRRWQNFTGRRATHAVTGDAFPG